MVTLKFENVSDRETFVIVDDVASITPTTGYDSDVVYPWAAGYSIGKFCYNCEFTETLSPGEEMQLVFFYSVFFDDRKKHEFIFQYDTLPPIIFTVK